MNEELIRIKELKIQEKEQAIKNAIIENDNTIILKAYSEYDLLYSDVLKSASIVKEHKITKANEVLAQTINQANEEYNKSITTANDTLRDKKSKLKIEQDNIIKISLEGQYDSYINDLDKIIKKYEVSNGMVKK